MVADMTCEEVMNKIYKDSDEAYDAKTDAQKESDKTSFETYSISDKQLESDSFTKGVRDDTYGDIVTMKDKGSWEYFWGTCVQTRSKLVPSSKYMAFQQLTRGYYWWFFFSSAEDTKVWTVLTERYQAMFTNKDPKDGVEFMRNSLSTSYTKRDAVPAGSLPNTLGAILYSVSGSFYCKKGFFGGTELHTFATQSLDKDLKVEADKTAKAEDYTELWKLLKEESKDVWDGEMEEIKQEECDREVKNEDFPKGKDTST